MPSAKHVRFASTNTLFSLSSPPLAIPWKDSFTKHRRASFSTYASSAPSMTHTSNSSSGSEKNTPPQPHHLLPPQLQPAPVPYTRSRRSSSNSSKSSSSQGTPLKTAQPLPTPEPQSISSKAGAGALQLHFLLAYSPFMHTCIKYDLSLHPSVLADYYPSKSLLEPATNPPVLSLTITCPQLKWPVFVTPSKFMPLGYVTVVDVLNCLYHDLRTTVQKHEYEGYLPNPDTKRNVDAAYFSRCGQITDANARKEEHLKGVKRVDFLMGRNRFMGLSGTRKHPNIWDLNVSTWAGD